MQSFHLLIDNESHITIADTYKLLQKNPAVSFTIKFMPFTNIKSFL